MELIPECFGLKATKAAGQITVKLRSAVSQLLDLHVFRLWDKTPWKQRKHANSSQKGPCLNKRTFCCGPSIHQESQHVAHLVLFLQNYGCENAPASNHRQTPLSSVEQKASTVIIITAVMETAAPASLSTFAPVHLINFCVVHTNLSFQSKHAFLHLPSSRPPVPLGRERPQDVPQFLLWSLLNGGRVISLSCCPSRSK